MKIWQEKEDLKQRSKERKRESIYAMGVACMGIIVYSKAGVNKFCLKIAAI